MLLTLVVLLGAAVVLVSLTRRAGFGSILGYLIAGALIGPSGLRLVTNVHSMADISELGVLMLLFIIGLELRLPRVWAMRRAVFGLGGAQVAVSGALLAVLAHLAGVGWIGAAILGGGLALSSTAIVLPLLGERGLLSGAAGRDSFAVLLFQDLASIPLIALVPVIAGTAPNTPLIPGLAKAVGAVALILFGGRFLIRPLFKLIGGVTSREVFTATSLLIVAAAATVAGLADLPLSLGAFAAGVVLAESEFRHELQADIEPFEGLLLGFFFMSVGMSANLALAVQEPATILLGVGGLLGVKIVVAWGLGRLRGQSQATAARFAFALPQGSEFAFVLFGAALTAGALAKPQVDRATLVVALSMLASPILFALSERYLVPQLDRKPRRKPDDVAGIKPAPVLILGFGRFGQIAGRVLRARGIDFTALDSEPDNVDAVRRFGYQAYLGDPTRLDLLKQVGADKARAIVVALPDADQVLKVCELAKTHFPQAKVYARARNRRHVHLLMDIGPQAIVRETFFSALRLTELMLTGLDYSPEQARRMVQLFREHDERRLETSYEFYTDEKRLVQNAAEAGEELRGLLADDAAR